MYIYHILEWQGLRFLADFQRDTKSQEVSSKIRVKPSAWNFHDFMKAKKKNGSLKIAYSR